jgi:Orange carotenoid protein, N-terminal
MNTSQETGRSSIRSEATQKIVKAFDALATDDKLALLYYVYQKMGDSITPAAPTAANPELAPQLLGEFYQLSDDQQLSVMREIVEGEDTQLSRAYGGLTENNQLAVWYAWAIGMGDTIVDMPPGYQASQPINQALSQIEGLDFEGQISTLREIAGNMGYSDVQTIPTQAETGKTASL